MKVLGGLGIVGLVVLLVWLTWSCFPLGELPPWEEATAAWGSKNAVAAIVLGARLWDTLFEVLVYALAIAGVALAAGSLGTKAVLPPLPETPLLHLAVALLLGPIGVFGLYVAVSGHLGPGGGFPAGALVGSGLLLLALARGTGGLTPGWAGGAWEAGKFAVTGAILLLGLGVLVLGARGEVVLVGLNVLIALEVALGAWVVLREFAHVRGEM